MTISTIMSEDFHDYLGLHNPGNGFRLHDTMVSSHNDTLLLNSTERAIVDFLNSSNSLVGIDASISPLQLQFYLNVPIDKMSQPSPASFPQNYIMKLYTNPKIMNSSNLGLDFAAYSPTNDTWDV